jgi:hypothetical protein
MTLGNNSILVTLAVVLMQAGCRSARGSPDALHCVAAVGELPSGATAAGLEGTYRVIFIGTGGEAQGRQLRGTLTLRLHDADRQRFYFFGRLNPHLLAPLYGRLDADLASLRAAVPGQADSDNPERPGVEVRQLDAVSQGRAFTEITLHVGDQGNRRDVMMFDGASFVMEVAEIDARGFTGEWKSSLGMTSFGASGHYCAWRVTKSAG